MLAAQLRAGQCLRQWTPVSSAPTCGLPGLASSPPPPLPPEYDIEAAQEKDRQAFKPTTILQTQKTNCDGYAGLFERMCRYSGGLG